MALKDSTLRNLVLVLCGVALLAALALGGMNVVTKEPIAKTQMAKVVNGIKEVLPPFNNNPVQDTTSVDVEGGRLKVYSAKLDESWVGCAVESFSNGFGGPFRIMVGFDAQGGVTGYSVLEHSETPGLGDKMTEWFKPPRAPEPTLLEKLFGFSVPAPVKNSNVYGTRPGDSPLTVSKDGGSVDAITAATISSRAFLRAVNLAYQGYAAVAGKDGDAVADATAKNE